MISYLCGYKTKFPYKLEGAARGDKMVVLQHGGAWAHLKSKRILKGIVYDLGQVSPFT